MSDEHDSWFRSAFDFDIGSAASSIAEAASSVAGTASDVVSSAAEGASSAASSVVAGASSVATGIADGASSKGSELAAGLQSLVLDVKTGNGAFMAKSKDAVKLAESLVAVANGAGLKTTALITDMNQSLASAAGNAVEVMNAVQFLRGKRDARLEDVTLALAAEMLVSTGIAKSVKEGLSLSKQALDGGKAAEVFARMVSALGGPADFMEKAESYLPAAPVIADVPAPEDGFVARVATRDLGLAVVALGGGRTRPQDKVDHAVGLTDLLPIGASVSEGDAIGTVHARSKDAAEEAIKAVVSAYGLAAKRPALTDAVVRRIG